MDPNFVQKRMDEIQRDESFVSAFSKIISGKSGYTAVIEKKHVAIICRGCGRQLEEGVKFCQECGTKVWIKPTKCPKCSALYHKSCFSPFKIRCPKCARVDAIKNKM